MEPKRGGIFALIGAIILFLSVPFAILFSLAEINTKYGLSLTFEQMLALFHETSLGIYILVISGIALNIILGVLLAILSGIVILRKGNDTIAILIIIGGILGSISSFLIGILGAVGAVLAMIGGGIASSATSLAPPEALFVAGGSIGGNKIVDWIFCETKFVVVHIASMIVSVIVGFIIILLGLIVGVNLNMNMYISGVWVVVVSLTVSWAIMTIQKNKSRRKLRGLSPDQILNAHPKNFALSYSDVNSIEAKQKILGTVVTLTWNGKKGIIEIRRSKLELEQANDLLMKLFGDKISFM